MQVVPYTGEIGAGAPERDVDVSVVPALAHLAAEGPRHGGELPRLGDVGEMLRRPADEPVGNRLDRSRPVAVSGVTRTSTGAP